MAKSNSVGKIGWIDLTVEDADQVREFYCDVAGWKSSAVEMGGYDDYCMVPFGDDNPVGGICHRRGPNESMPGGWLIYITVSDLEASKSRCKELGGKIIVETRNIGSGLVCVIEDPSGAKAALYQEL